MYKELYSVIPKKYNEIGDMFPGKRTYNTLFIDNLIQFYEFQSQEEEVIRAIMKEFSFDIYKSKIYWNEIVRAADMVFKRENSIKLKMNHFIWMKGSNTIRDLYQKSFDSLSNFIFEYDSIMATKNKDNLHPFLFPGGIGSCSSWSATKPKWQEKEVYNGMFRFGESEITGKDLIYPSL